MEKDHLSRKLAVILHADVVGSTALVQRNETLAHEGIQDTFRRFSEIIHSHDGIAHEIRGDALVAEFGRASDALNASLTFQAANIASNLQNSDDFQPMLRVGIAMGEVVIADNTVTGEGVVLAQRLEQLAKNGGVCIQGAAYETVPKRLPFKYENLGEQVVKGFEEPVKAYSVSLKSENEISESHLQIQAKVKAQDLPKKPSIAVLPFTNMSTDPEQEFFGDGISEDIITALSKTSALTVIARNSTFTYKGKAVDVKKLGLDLAVHYVLEGSVRKSGSRVRVTAQLIDAATNQHIWAERYDRDLEDFFAVQDEIMREIVSALDVQLLAGEQSRFWSGGTQNLQAWEYFRLARDLFNSYRTENHREVIRLARKSIEADSNYAAAWDLLAGCYFHMKEDARYSKEERKQALKLSREYTQRALECDPTFADAYSVLSLLRLNSKQYDEAAINTNKSVEMAPNNANNIAVSAIVLNKCGESEIALERIRKAMRLSPVYPLWYIGALGQVCRSLGMTEESIDAFSEMIRRDPDSLEGHIGLTEILGESGQIEAATVSAAGILKANPNFSISEYTDNLAYRDSAEILRFEEGLRIAGLPE
ncbi:MAG: adenylate/guanylate cyclase domain-containing protein [bacterium]